jgi:deoxycytidine triphosphate deaminase
MIIKPIDILYMLDDEDLASMDYEDMSKLCNAISLDLQLEKESYGNENLSNRGTMC